MESTTDDRSLSAESLEVDESSSLKHGEEQVREAPSESNYSDSKQNQEKSVASIRQEVHELRKTVESLQEQHNQTHHLVANNIMPWMSELLKRTNSFTTTSIDPDNPPAWMNDIEQRIADGDKLAPSDVATILDQSTKTARRKMRKISRAFDWLEFVHSSDRPGNKPSIIKHPDLDSDNQAADEAREEFDNIASGLMGGAQ